MLLEVKDFSSYPLRSKDFSSNAGNQTLPPRGRETTHLCFFLAWGGRSGFICWLPPGLKPGEAQSRRLLIPMAPRCCVGQAGTLSVLAIMNTDFRWDSEQHGLLLATESSRLTMTSEHLSN